jgi:hypothetical protein
MAVQLDKILEVSALPNVVGQVLPYEVGAHPAVESNYQPRGLSLLVELLTLVTSLALLARSRAWVVFRWVGAATPAQRRVSRVSRSTWLRESPGR